MTVASRACHDFREKQVFSKTICRRKLRTFFFDEQIAEFVILAQKKSKFIKLLNTAILSIIMEGDPDLATYFNYSGQAVQNSKTTKLGFAHQNSLGHTLNQIPILNEMFELEMKEGMN